MAQVIDHGNMPTVTLRLPDGREQELQVLNVEMHLERPVTEVARYSGELATYMAGPTEIRYFIEGRAKEILVENLQSEVGFDIEQCEETVLEWLDRRVREVRNHG